MNDDIPTISTFKELLNQIGFCWDWPRHSFRSTDEGYVLSDLIITPEFVTYKTETWELEPEVFEEFERFLQFLESTEKHTVSYY